MLDFVNAHPNTRFSLLHGGFPWTSDIIAFFDVTRNVYADVCWMPLLSPTSAAQTLHMIIEAATSEKIVWGCDTWTGEESLGARIMMNEVITVVLAEKVESGYMMMQDAKRLAKKPCTTTEKSCFLYRFQI